METPRLHQLVLIRHADALPAAPMQADETRALSPQGWQAARRSGQWLGTQAVPPQVLLCSPARRTRETLQGMQEAGLELPPVRLEPRIYEASAGTLLALVEDYARQFSPHTLWLIGHNPGLEAVLWRLLGDAPPPAMSTAAVAVVQCQPGQALAAAGTARLQAFHAP